MSTAYQFYISSLLIYFGVNVLACWGLNLQIGVTGIINFAFVLFQAAGAYTAAVLTLGPAISPADGGFQSYIGGANLPFPLPLLAAALVGALLSLVVGVLALRRLRADYLALVMLVVSQIAVNVVQNQNSLFNGSAGLSLVPEPLADFVHLAPLSLAYQWFYAGLTGVICLIVYFFVHQITGSPLGRVLRAIRDNEQAAVACGKNVFVLRMFAFMTGGAIAAISGAMLVMFIGTWAPAAWLYPETFVLLGAVVIGGSGNNLGVMVGALLVPVAFLEAPRYLPPIPGHPELIEPLEWIITALLMLLFLWFRPEGIVPERRRRFSARAVPARDLRESA
ncbi:MAG TPA: branched-chain amino acid ABC transporter permease [Chloroflexota bacterium]